MFTELERFLPFIDNWATCDLLAVRTIKKHLDVFIEEVYRWVQSQHTYTIRFGIGMLMRYYLDENFQMEYPEKVMQICSKDVLCEYDAGHGILLRHLQNNMRTFIPFIEDKKLDVWTHNKTIQKAIESYRITPEQKIYLRNIKNKVMIPFEVTK